MGRAAVAAALLRRAKLLGSFDRDAFSNHVAMYLHKEIAGGIVETQPEKTTLGVAIGTHSNLLTQVNCAQEVSSRVVIPHPVGQFKSPVRCSPHTQTNVTPSWVDIRVVHFGAASIPELVGLLSGLAVHHKQDVPKSNDGRVVGIVSGRSRLRLHLG